jgi:hypothetical protein
VRRRNGCDELDELAQATATIFQKYPQLHDLLTEDVKRERLRVIFKCPKGHPIETAVLDADRHRERLNVLSATLYDNNFMVSDVKPYALNTFEAFKDRPTTPTMNSDRVRLECPRKNCRYSGVKTQRELVTLFVLARFVLNTPDIRMPD